MILGPALRKPNSLLIDRPSSADNYLTTNLVSSEWAAMLRLSMAMFIIGSSAAFAQMNVMVNGETDVTHAPYALSTNDCNSNARITFTVPNGACQNTAGIFVTTNTSCASTPGSSDVQVALNPDGVSGNIRVSNLATFQSGDAGTLSCPQPVKSLNKVCGTYRTSTGAFGDCSQSNSGGFATIYYKGLPPDPPTLDSVTPLDTQITVSASTSESDVIAIHVELAVSDGGQFFVERAVFTPFVGSAKISGLINGVTYDVRARAEDQVPQFSNYTDIVEVTPVETQGFWGTYLASGGADRGGCGGLAAIVFAWSIPGIALVLLTRRSRRSKRLDKP